MLFFVSQTDINYGVPQGSSLVPIVFVLYTFSLCNISHHNVKETHIFSYMSGFLLTLYMIFYMIVIHLPIVSVRGKFRFLVL